MSNNNKDIYDPKLSEAGFMDLVQQLVKRLYSDDAKLALRQKPINVHEAAEYLRIAACNYVIAVEGPAVFAPLPNQTPEWYLQGEGRNIPQPSQFSIADSVQETVIE